MSGRPANGFFVRCKCKFRRFTGGKSRNLHAADGGKGIARRAAELCGGALILREEIAKKDSRRRPTGANWLVRGCLKSRCIRGNTLLFPLGCADQSAFREGFGERLFSEKPSPQRSFPHSLGSSTRISASVCRTLSDRFCTFCAT